MLMNNKKSPPGETAGSEDAGSGSAQEHGAATEQAGRGDVSGLPSPPYPSKTKAGGYKFELDCERMLQSDTFAIASPHLRPVLVYLWIQSWMQIPAGSLPDDDAVLAARIGLAPSEFEANKQILMRGWRRASDGRLYHPVITEQVLGMVERKSKNAAYQASHRQRAKAVANSEAAGHSANTDAEVSAYSQFTESTTTNTTTNTTSEAERQLPGTEVSSGQGILIPLKGGGEYAITESEIAEWTRAYPGTDVVCELRKARAWCIANVARRKTQRGVTSFLNRWLARQPLTNSHPKSSAHTGFDSIDYQKDANEWNNN